MTTHPTRVLLGDSTPSELPPNILDLITQVVLCARDVATPFAEVHELERRRSESARVTEAVVQDLERFGLQTEVGVRATASAAVRPEVRAHGNELIEAVGRMIAGWQQQHERKRDATAQQVSQRITALRQAMHAAVERFLLPCRTDAPVQRFHRFFDGQRYLDTAVVEPFEGVLTMLSLADSELEVPRRVRSLLGKGNKIQVGTRRSRIRRIEEPVMATIDDLLLLDAERGPGRLCLSLAKKPGVSEVVRIEIVRSDDGLLAGRASRGDGDTVGSPITDRPVLQSLWTALDAERERILGCPAQLVELSLDGRRVEDAAAMLAVAERLVDCYRSTVTILAQHSPNPEELTIKIESPGGKREETWIRRAELAQHLVGLPAELRGRVGIAELFDPADMVQIKAPVRAPVTTMVDEDEDQSVPIEIAPDETMADDMSTREDSPGDMVQDLSLDDVLDVEEYEDEDEDGYMELTQVRSR